jgi:hypothetical protein
MGRSGTVLGHGGLLGHDGGEPALVGRDTSREEAAVGGEGCRD